MPSSEPEPGNLWLARALWDSGGVLFGQFDIGTTVDSPIYVNVRRIISNPRALRQIGDLITDETRMLGGMLRPHIQPFELVAGVPLGGLHIATAFSLTSDVPLIYPHPRSEEHEVYEEIEGSYLPGQSVLLVDDVLTGGGSVQDTAERLRTAGLMVHDAIVLLDRQAGGPDRLEAEGIRTHPLLTMDALLNYLVSRELITEAIYAKCLTYMGQTLNGGEL